jgi:uncharacterized protein
MDNLTSLQTAIVLGMLAAGALVQGYSGFGFGILATSLLALLDLNMAGMAAVVTFGALCTSLVLLPITRAEAHIDWRRALLILSGNLCGQPAGYWFIHTWGDRPVFRIALGAVLLAFAVNGMVTPHVRRRLPLALAPAVGLAGGFLAGAFVTGGPPVILYLYSQTDDPRTMKATVQFIFLISTAYRLVWVGVSGDMTLPVVRLALLSLPVVLPVLVLAHALSKRISVAGFRRAVFAVILLTGGAVLGRGLALC